MTVQQNNVVVPHTPPIDYPILTDATADINAGDLVYMDTSAHVVKSVGSDANCQYLAGMALQGSYVQPYSTKNYQYQIPVLSRGIVSLYTTAAETYYDGTALYYGGDAQTVTTVAGTYIVGYAKMRPGVSSLTGASGVKVDVLLATKYPVSTF